MTAVAEERTAASRHAKPPLWRDVRVLRIIAQVLLVGGVLVLLWWLASNFITNFQAGGLPTGFDFLNQPYGVDIAGCADCARRSVRNVLIFGYINTVRIALVGVVLATILGTIIGVARLSQNLVTRTIAALYVQTVRNIPVYVWIFFFFFGVIQKVLPPLADPIELFGFSVLSNNGIWIPWIVGEGGGFASWIQLMGVALLLGVAVAVWRTRVNQSTGKPHHRVLYATLLILVLGAVLYVALGAPFNVNLPLLTHPEGRVVPEVTGGLKADVSYAGLLIALVVYTASHIAEIVRGSIQAVPKGQTEAARAIGLSNFQRLRYVVLPQALRIMIPPMSNQYLNLVKNSSLAVAIGYFDITRVVQTVSNNAAPAPQGYALLMLGYLTFSLGFSIVANIINRRLRLETR